MIQKAGGVKIVDQATNREYHLKPGEHRVPFGDYQIEVSDPLAGLQFQTEKFELKRGKDVRLTAKFVPNDREPQESAAPKIVARVEDVYEGKPAGFWVKQLRTEGPKKRVEALFALQVIARGNKDCLPLLIDSLNDVDYEVVQNARTVVSRFGADVVPALVDILKNRKSPYGWKNAARTLGLIGPIAKAAIPGLIQGLQSDDDTIVSAAMDALGELGVEARVALPNMTEALGVRLKFRVAIYNNDGFAFGYVLAQTFSKLDTETEPIFETVREHSQGPNSPAEWQKIYDALKKKYPEPPPQTAFDPFKGPLPYVDGPLYLGKPASFWLNQLQDSAPQFRLEALEALGNLARKNKELVPVLVSLLTDDGGVSRDKETRIVGNVASTILSSFGPDVLPVLLERVDRTSPTVLRRAAGIVGGFGPTAHPRFPC